jgi:zinc protease
MKKGNWTVKNNERLLMIIRSRKSSVSGLFFSTFCLLTFAFGIFAQENPPAPSAPPNLNIPQVKSGKLPNDLEVVSVERRNVPLVTVSLLTKSGANVENNADAGLADMTASLLLKGTKMRTATQIAEEIEFLGGNINSGAGWNSSNVTLNVTSDKLDQALAIMSDTILNPTFLPKEVQLYKTQAIDNLNVQLKQPSSLAGFVASLYSFGEHAAFGTPESLAKINRLKINAFYRKNFLPSNAVLIFAGDVTQEKAMALAKKYFSGWRNLPVRRNTGGVSVITGGGERREPRQIFERLLVIDLPNAGQAAVTYAKKLNFGRLNENSNFFPSIVANSILGGGYSARLNQEIRIKRGLSYGASSNLSWRANSNNILARAQTKNVSAAQVAELIAAEINKLTTDSVLQDELSPRKAVLTGSFGRSLETTNGLAAQIADLYTFGLKPEELNSYMQNVRAVSDTQVKNFASANITGGDIIIVGDAKVFMDDLKRRFPDKKIEVISIPNLDLNQKNLRKTQKASSGK